MLTLASLLAILSSFIFVYILKRRFKLYPMSLRNYEKEIIGRNNQKYGNIRSTVIALVVFVQCIPSPNNASKLASIMSEAACLFHT